MNYEFKINADTPSPLSPSEKDESTCNELHYLNNRVYTCATDSKHIKAINLQEGGYLGNSFIKIKDFATRSIESFHVNNHVSEPHLIVITKADSGSSALKTETYKLKSDGEFEFVSSATLRDVSQGLALLINNQARAMKTGSHFSLYNVLDACPDNLQELDIRNGDTGKYCFTKCTAKRVILGDEPCGTTCPSKWDELNYLDLAANGKVCAPRPSIDHEARELRHVELALTFNSPLNATELPAALCLIAEHFSWPTDRLVSNNVRCSKSAERLRVLQQSNHVLGTLIFVDISPLLASQDLLHEHISNELTTLVEEFNQEKPKDFPAMTSANFSELKAQASKPSTADEIKINRISSQFNGSAFNFTFNVTHGNLLVTFGWTDFEKNKTMPSYDALRQGIDGNGTRLNGTFNILTQAPNQTFSFIVPKSRNVRRFYSFFVAAETRGIVDQLKTAVTRYNITIDGTNFAQISNGFGLALLFLALSMFIFI